MQVDNLRKFKRPINFETSKASSNLNLETGIYGSLGPGRHDQRPCLRISSLQNSRSGQIIGQRARGYSESKSSAHRPRPRSEIVQPYNQQNGLPMALASNPYPSLDDPLINEQFPNMRTPSFEIAENEQLAKLAFLKNTKIASALPEPTERLEWLNQHVYSKQMSVDSIFKEPIFMSTASTRSRKNDFNDEVQMQPMLQRNVYHHSTVISQRTDANSSVQADHNRAYHKSISRGNSSNLRPNGTSIPLESPLQFNIPVSRINSNSSVYSEKSNIVKDQLHALPSIMSQHSRYSVGQMSDLLAPEKEKRLEKEGSFKIEELQCRRTRQFGRTGKSDLILSLSPVNSLISPEPPLTPGLQHSPLAIDNPKSVGRIDSMKYNEQTGQHMFVFPNRYMIEMPDTKISCMKDRNKTEVLVNTPKIPRNCHGNGPVYSFPIRTKNDQRFESSNICSGNALNSRIRPQSVYSERPVDVASRTNSTPSSLKKSLQEVANNSDTTLACSIELEQTDQELLQDPGKTKNCLSGDFTSIRSTKNLTKNGVISKVKCIMVKSSKTCW